MGIIDIVKDIWKKSEGKSTIKTILIISIVAVILVFLTFNWFFEFSAFAVSILKAIMGFTLVWLIDRFAIPEVNTMEELKKGNIAYAIFMLGISIVIAAAIIAA